MMEILHKSILNRSIFLLFFCLRVTCYWALTFFKLVNQTTLLTSNYYIYRSIRRFCMMQTGLESKSFSLNSAIRIFCLAKSYFLPYCKERS